MEAPKTVLIDVGGEKVIKVKPELFSVAGDNHFASMFSERWQHVLDEEGRLFVDYSPQVFVPLIEFLRLVRDSEPDMKSPVVVEPAYRRAWIRMMLVSSFHPGVLRKAGVTAQELRETGCNEKFLRDAGFKAPTDSDLRNGASRATWMQAGWFDQKRKELLEAGYSLKELRDAGHNAAELRKSGLALQELVDGGFSLLELVHETYLANSYSLNCRGLLIQ